MTSESNVSRRKISDVLQQIKMRHTETKYMVEAILAGDL